MTSLPEVLSDRYKIVRRVGTGGMADVYLARDIQLQRQVALKVLHSQYASDQVFVDRFRREAQSAASLQHPNIVQIYDWGRDAKANTHFIVMEFVDGRSLKDVIAAEGRLEPKEAARIADQVLAALTEAHKAGIVHRDIKPANVLLDADGKAQVTDFGIARAAEADTMTQTGTILGTAYYLSPEQAQGAPLDGRSDIYSLGVVLYEMLTGKRIFEGESPVAIAMKHVREQPKPPSVHRPDLPSDLAAITLTALAKDPDDRYSTAAQMRRDLQSFMSGKSVSAVMPSPAAVADDSTQVIRTVSADKRAAARRPGWLLALALTLLISGLAVGAWSAVNLLRPVVTGATVPDIVNRTATDAESALRERGLEGDFQGNESSETVEEGRVTRQLPAPGRSVTEGTPVKYWVSTGLPEVSVPNLDGMSLEQAKAKLKELNLQLGKIIETFAEVEPGTVLDQNPRAGSVVRAKTPVDLTVSKGEETVTVPDVVGADEGAAVLTLSNAGFKVTRTVAPSNEVPEGRVFAQDPPGGELRAKGSIVQIFVAGQPQQFAMPDVIGRKEAEAKGILEDRDLNVEVIKEFTPDPAKRDRVLRTNPDRGTQVQRGQTVQIVVGSS